MTPLLLGVVMSLGLSAAPPVLPGRYFTEAHRQLCEKAADLAAPLASTLVPAGLVELSLASGKGRRPKPPERDPRAAFLAACMEAPYDLVTCLSKAATPGAWAECGGSLEAECNVLVQRPELEAAFGGGSVEAARTRCFGLSMEQRACLRAAKDATEIELCDQTADCDEAVAVIAEVIGADETVPEKTRRAVMLALSGAKGQYAEAHACRRLPSALRSCLLSAADGRGLDACARGEVFDLDSRLAALDPFSPLFTAACDAAEQNAKALEVPELSTLSGCRTHAYETLLCLARAGDADAMTLCVRERRRRCEFVLARLSTLVEENTAMPTRDRRALLDALLVQASGVIDECVREPEPVLKCLAGDGEAPMEGLDLLPRIASCPERVSCDRAFHNLRELVAREIPRQFQAKAFDVLERRTLVQVCRAVPEPVRRCVESASSLAESAACSEPQRK